MAKRQNETDEQRVARLAKEAKAKRDKRAAMLPPIREKKSKAQPKVEEFPCAVCGVVSPDGGPCQNCATVEAPQPETVPVAEVEAPAVLAKCPVHGDFFNSSCAVCTGKAPEIILEAKAAIRNAIQTVSVVEAPVVVRQPVLAIEDGYCYCGCGVAMGNDPHSGATGAKRYYASELCAYRGMLRREGKTEEQVAATIARITKKPSRQPADIELAPRAPRVAPTPPAKREKTQDEKDHQDLKYGPERDVTKVLRVYGDNNQRAEVEMSCGHTRAWYADKSAARCTKCIPKETKVKVSSEVVAEKKERKASVKAERKTARREERNGTADAKYGPERKVVKVLEIYGENQQRAKVEMECGHVRSWYAGQETARCTKCIPADATASKAPKRVAVEDVDPKQSMAF